MEKPENQAPAAPPRPAEPLLRLDAGAAEALRRSGTADLRALVRFAIGRGYYDRWNRPPDAV